jgi:hypothetical protein
MGISSSSLGANGANLLIVGQGANDLMYYSAVDSAWKPIPGTPAQGDIILFGASGVPALLNIGSANQVLTSNGTTASWSAPSVQNTDTVTRTAGDVTTTSTTLVDLTGMTLTKITATGKVQIWFSGSFRNDGSNVDMYWAFDVDGTPTGELVDQEGGANNWRNISFHHQTAALTAASHTFKVQWRVGSGTGTFNAASGEYNELALTELAA